MKSGGQVQEIAQDLAAVLAGDTLRMELDSEHRAVAVLNGHDEPIVTLRADLEVGGRACSLDDERVIARRLKGSVQAAEEPARTMRNARDLAVHRRWRAHDVAAESLPNRLMPETYAKHRRRFAGRADEVEAHARLVGRARPGRKHDRVRFRGERVRDCDLIVAPHGHFGAQLAEVMDEVEGEAV